VHSFESDVCLSGGMCLVDSNMSWSLYLRDVKYVLEYARPALGLLLSCFKLVDDEAQAV